MTLPTSFQFSQGSLQDFVDSPRRFQLKLSGDFSHSYKMHEVHLRGLVMTAILAIFLLVSLRLCTLALIFDRDYS